MPRKYWWGILHKETSKGSKVWLLGPYNSERDVEEKIKKFDTDKYSIQQFPTRDKSRASSILKAKLHTTQRMRHVR